MTRRNEIVVRRPGWEPSRARWVLAASALLGALACQSERAPALQSEPPAVAVAPAAAPAAVAPADVAAPAVVTPSTPAAAEAEAAASARVGLAKYEEPSAQAKPSAAAAAPAAAKAVTLADAPKPAAGGTVQGAAITEEPFSIWLQASSPVAAGSAAKVEAVLLAKSGYHCNAEYPHKFKLGPAPAGLSYPEATVKGMQVTPERSVLAIPVQAQAPGKAKVSGTLAFSVCNEERCLVEKRELALELDVK